MANTQSIGKTFDDQAAYAQSFGNMRTKTAYYNPFMKSRDPDQKVMDLRPGLKSKFSQGFNQMKAHGTEAGGAGTAGFAMVPVFVDPIIVDETRKYTPAVETFPRVTNQGMFADFNNLTAKGGGFTAVENAPLSAKDNTYDRNSTKIKFLYAVGSVTGPSQAAQPSYILQGFQGSGANGGFTDQAGPNSMQTEILVQSRAIKELEENLIFNGNSTTSGIAGNPNGTEFDGIITLMGSTNTVDKNTSALELKDLTRAVRYAFDDGGRPNVAYAASAVYEDIEILLKEKFGFMQSEKQVFWGFSTITLRTMVGEIPIIPSMYLSNTSGSKAIYFLDMAVVEVRVLQDMTFFRLGVTRDAEEFALKQYETLIIRNTGFCASVTEISA